MTIFVAAPARHSYAFSHPRRSTRSSSSSSRKESSSDKSEKSEESEEEQPTPYGGKDEYLDALKEIAGKYPAVNLKKGQRKAAKEYRGIKHYSSESDQLSKRLESMKGDYSSIDLDDKGELMALARYGMASDNMKNILNGAKIYEKLGQGGRASVKRRLVRGFEKGLHAAEENYKNLSDQDSKKTIWPWDYDKDPSVFVNHYAPQLEIFFKKNPTKPLISLEKTVGTAAIVGIIGGISLLSTSITGNVIGYATVVGSSILGAALLVVGLTAGFFWVQGRKGK